MGKKKNVFFNRPPPRKPPETNSPVIQSKPSEKGLFTPFSLTHKLWGTPRTYK